MKLYSFNEKNDEMMLRIIDDVYKALDSKAYMAALALALTIPDICGKVEYGNGNVGNRYKKWFDEYIGKYEIPNWGDRNVRDMPHLTGEVIYSLRNAVLHQGNPNINESNIHEEINKLTHFVIEVESKKEYDIYSDSSEYSVIGGDVRKSYHANLRNLCMKICETARGYYDENRERFDIFDYNIVDLDAQKDALKKFDN